MAKYITIERFVHVLLFCFAFASTGTISDFMTANEHGFLTSWGLAVALGFGLVAVSMMLAGASMDDTDTFRGILAGVVVVACMSATVQTMAYHEHASNWFVASVLGVGFPLIECVLAFGVALHDASEKRKQVLHVRDNIQRRISESVGDAMSDIDLSKVRTHIEKRVDSIIRQQVDIVVDSMGLIHASTQGGEAIATMQPSSQVSTQAVTQESVQVGTQPFAQASVQGDASTGAQLDEIDEQIIEAVRNGHCTPYAISKVVDCAQTTLKRKRGDVYVGRIPNLVTAGILHNSSGDDGNEYRLA